MNRFFGEIGFSFTEETKPGIFKTKKVARNYYGNIIKNGRRTQNSNQINDSITMDVTISILADNFAIEKNGYITYVVYCKQKWKVTSTTIDGHRVILYLGGVYNG